MDNDIIKASLFRHTIFSALIENPPNILRNVYGELRIAHQSATNAIYILTVGFSEESNIDLLEITQHGKSFSFFDLLNNRKINSRFVANKDKSRWLLEENGKQTVAIDHHVPVYRSDPRNFTVYFEKYFGVPQFSHLNDENVDSLKTIYERFPMEFNEIYGDLFTQKKHICRVCQLLNLKPNSDSNRDINKNKYLPNENECIEKSEKKNNNSLNNFGILNGFFEKSNLVLCSDHTFLSFIYPFSETTAFKQSLENKSAIFDLSEVSRFSPQNEKNGFICKSKKTETKIEKDTEGVSQYDPKKYIDSIPLIEKINNNFNNLYIEFVNKYPTWHDKAQCHVLDFQGRIKIPNSSNFMLIDKSYPDECLMRFGSLERTVFACDFSFPINAVQAASIGISMIHPKILDLDEY